MKETQVKSKKRVADHGEVFTNKREVNAMLDLVKQETERIDSRFLEPACGTGNFLVEILERKLKVVEARYKKSQLEYERNAITALSSIYGVDILEDNVQACRDRLLGVFTKYYLHHYKKDFNEDFLKSAEFILQKNIIWGDALSMLTTNGKPITFSEWSPVNGNMLKRRDFQLNKLLENTEFDKDEINLFSDLDEPVFIPQPVAEFPLTHFLKIAEYD
ncbi:MAG: SAM-dependent DNA methyltransferase [Flavobacteriia bacterium]|nr:SAM-dependent DNA methyltransferase [Flavobacteriia bacterium]